MVDFWNIGLEGITILFCTGVVIVPMMLIFSDELRDLFNKFGS